MKDTFDEKLLPEMKKQKVDQVQIDALKGSFKTKAVELYNSLLDKLDETPQILFRAQRGKGGPFGCKTLYDFDLSLDFAYKSKLKDAYLNLHQKILMATNKLEAKDRLSLLTDAFLL